MAERTAQNIIDVKLSEFTYQERLNDLRTIRSEVVELTMHIAELLADGADEDICIEALKRCVAIKSRSETVTGSLERDTDPMYQQWQRQTDAYFTAEAEGRFDDSEEDSR